MVTVSGWTGWQGEVRVKGGSASRVPPAGRRGEATTLLRFIVVNGGKAGSFSAFDHQFGSIHNPTTCVIAYLCPTMNAKRLKLTG
jgi:hypothetical protein